MNDPGVWANSNTSLSVAPNTPAVNTFAISDNYVVGAGASDQPVQLSSNVSSFIVADAFEADYFDAIYADVPPREGPILVDSGAKSPQGTIAISANHFDQGSNEAQGWFGNMSFGIRLAQGFIGMSWSPHPGETTTLTPRLNFYVTIGFYSNNTLASWNQISNSSALLKIPNSFLFNKATVIYTSTGSWEVVPGEPP